MGERTKTILLKILKIVLILVGIFIVIRISLLSIPFVIGFIISSLIEPLIRFLNRKAKIPRRLGAVIGILFVLGIVGTIIGFLISRLVREIQNVYNNFSAIYISVEQAVTNIGNKLSEFYIMLPEEFSQQVDDTIKDILSWVQDLIKPVAGFTLNAAFSLPQIIVFIIVTILCIYFMSSDREKINELFKSMVPDIWLSNTQNFINDMFHALLGWVKAQVILMTLTFSELTFGFILMKMPNALLLAVLIAFVDALPILGTGTILIPWGIILIIIGNIKMGISILLLYIICIVVRQLVEPKILGSQIGVHPLLTLFAMYFGLQLLGFPGMIIGPITMVILKNIYDTLSKNCDLKGYLNKKYVAHKKETVIADEDNVVNE